MKTTRTNSIWEVLLMIASKVLNLEQLATQLAMIFRIIQIKRRMPWRQSNNSGARN